MQVLQIGLYKLCKVYIGSLFYEAGANFTQAGTINGNTKEELFEKNKMRNNQ